MKEDFNAGISPELRELLLPMQAQINSLQRQLDNTVAVKDAEIKHLKEVIELYQRMLFGSKSEKTRYLFDMNQMSLFHTPAASENSTGNKKVVVVKEHTREVESKENREDYISLMVKSGKFPVETVVCDVPEAERVDSDGNPLERIGTEHVRYELEVTPKQYTIKDIQVVSYGSKKEEGSRAEVRKAEVPTAIIPHSPASASFLADNILNKCDYALPMYRQARMMQDMGVPIHRNTLCEGFIASAKLLHPVWDGMKDAMKQLSAIHADETFGQVLHNATGNPRAQLDYWAYCSGKWELVQVACFEYCPSREGKNARHFLEEYTGKIITDGCSSYKAIEHLERGGCWAHTRRYWYRALPPELRSKKTKGEKLDDDALQTADPEKCAQLKCLLLINDLFMYEQQYDREHLTASDRLARRRRDCTPVLEQYWQAVETLAAENTTGNLHKAVTYSLNQKQYLMKFMEDGKLAISNNAVERLIRNLVIGRKNWLFCDTEDGARAVATLYSIVVTAHVNGLDVRAYLEHLLRAMAEADHGKKPLFDEDLRAYVKKLLPWDDDIQARFLADDPFECKSYTANSKAVW